MKSKLKDIKHILKNIIIIYKHEGCNVCDKVASIIKKNGFSYRRHVRDKVTSEDFNAHSFVVIVGGDGTTLRVTNKIRNDSLVFTVNSAPSRTEGFLCRATEKDFDEKLKRIISGDFKIKRLPRLQVLLNGKQIADGLALNEVSVSPYRPYQTMIYNLKNRIEKASGIIISTPIGSTGWCKSTGGKVMSLSSEMMQFVVREPYFGRIYKVKERSGIVSSFKMKAISEGIIVFDAIHTEHPFVRDDIIEVKRSDKPLNFIDF